MAFAARTLKQVLIIVLILGCRAVSRLGAAAPPQTISLNGDWNFLADPTGKLTVNDLAGAANVRPTRVPSSWQEQFTDLRDYAGVAWYWKTIEGSAPPPGQVALLRFDAVDYRAEVFVNAQKARSHDGGYLPFEFDVTRFLKPADNVIAVRVVDPGANPNEVEGIKYAEIPHGKQNWYVQTSGLWQGVELEFRPPIRLGQVHISGGADGGFKIHVPVVTAEGAGLPAAPLALQSQMEDASGKIVWQDSTPLRPGQDSCDFAGKIASPNLWSPSNPSLYTLRETLSSGDSQSFRFGFRTFETRGGKFYLNGQVMYLRGALDQDFYPDTGYTPPSLDFIRDEMRKAKALGLNLLRCHIKVPDPRYLEAADEEGILIWYEIPNWDKLTTDSEARALQTLRGMIDRDWNHPSIIMVSLINESWGANLKEPGPRAWLKATYEQAKTMVPGWLVDDNSACCDNFHVETDLADFHEYSAIPDYAENFDRVIADMATRPGWLFSPYGDAKPKGDEPLVLSEFGNWGLPHPPDPRPWWFGRSFGNNPMTVPAGVRKRFDDYQYATLFADFDSLADAAEWREFQSLKYEIESLRSRPAIQGYVVTEFTDVNWESNGLLDMWRRPKDFAAALGKLQQDDLVMARADTRNVTSGGPAQANIYFSHYSDSSLTGATVTWEVKSTPLYGSFPLPGVERGTSASVGKIQFVAPKVAAPAKAQLAVQVEEGGKVLSENSLSFYFYPPTTLELPPPVSFHDPAGRLRRLESEMGERGYASPAGNEAFPVLISSMFDDATKKALQNGARVILIATDAQKLAPGIEIVPRQGSNLDGNWISSFLWIRKGQGPFKGIGFDTFPGFETEDVTPITVVRGVPAQNFKDVLSGMFYGWIHSSVGTLVQAKCGKGKLLILTFDVATAYGSDPYATELVDALVEYAVTDFNPQFEIPLAAP